MKKAVIFMLVSLLLAGCSARKTYDTVPMESSTVVQTEPTISAAVSDEELIVAVIESKALHAWGLMSLVPESAEGIKALTDNCPEFKELLGRDSGLQSLKEYGPEIAEEYRKHEDSYYRLNAMMMQELLVYLFPWLQNEIMIE